MTRCISPTQSRYCDVKSAPEVEGPSADEKEPPFWIGAAVEEGTVDPSTLIACRNGLLNIEIREPIPHSPLLLNVNSLPFDYDPDAPEPEKWLEFLLQIWPKDEEAERTLQQIFGLLLTADRSEAIGQGHHRPGGQRR